MSQSTGKLRWLISCDESGVHGAKYYGFGTLWMRWQRRGDFARDFRDIKKRVDYIGEIKWNKAESRKYHSLFADLVKYFFSNHWLTFHCIVVRKGMVDKSLHKGSYDVARRKHFTLLLTNKISRCLNVHKAREQTFRIWVDPIASSYRKADEAVEIISNNVLGRLFGELRPVDKVITRDSKNTPSIQLCDLLLGAVMDAWQQKAKSVYKLGVQRLIAKHLGWPDLRADTYDTERKFNIWYLHDKGLDKREARTRKVSLIYPLP